MQKERDGKFISTSVFAKWWCFCPTFCLVATFCFKRTICIFKAFFFLTALSIYGQKLIGWRKQTRWMNSFISKNWTFKRELIDDFIYSLNVYVGVQLFCWPPKAQGSNLYWETRNWEKVKLLLKRRRSVSSKKAAYFHCGKNRCNNFSKATDVLRLFAQKSSINK